MNNSELAVAVSVVALLTSIGALVWNVWQKFIFVRPSLQVTFQVMAIFVGGRRIEKKLCSLNITNMGPGPVIVHACIVKGWDVTAEKPFHGVVNPIDGDPLANPPISKGPFSGGLPHKMNPGDVKQFYFNFDEVSLLAQPIFRVGVADTYNRNSWCRRRDIDKARESFRRASPNAAAVALEATK